MMPYNQYIELQALEKKALKEKRKQAGSTGYIRFQRVIAARLRRCHNGPYIRVNIKAYCKTYGVCERTVRGWVRKLRAPSDEFTFRWIHESHPVLLVAFKANLTYDQMPLFYTRKGLPRHCRTHHFKRVCEASGPPPFLTTHHAILKCSINMVPLVQLRNKQQPVTPQCFQRKFSVRIKRRVEAKKNLLRKTLFERGILEKSHRLRSIGCRNAVNFPKRHAFNVIATGLLHGVMRNRIHRAWFRAVDLVHAANCDGLTVSESALLSFHAKRLLFLGDDRSTSDRVTETMNLPYEEKVHKVRKMHPNTMKKIEEFEQLPLKKRQEIENQLLSQADQKAKEIVASIVRRPSIPDEKPALSWSRQIAEKEKDPVVRKVVWPESVSKKGGANEAHCWIITIFGHAGRCQLTAMLH